MNISTQPTSLVSSALLVICLVGSLTACPSHDIAPGREYVSVEYVGISEDDVGFTLTNASTKPVYVRGNRTLTFAIEVWIGDREFTCRAKPGDAPSVEFAGFADGGRGPARFKVSPGDHVRLVIPTRFPQRHKGNLCQLRLTLEGDTAVESNEFVP